MQGNNPYCKGSFVRIGPNELSIGSTEVAREVFRAGKGFHKTDFYSVFPPPESRDIFTEVQEDVHAQRKRMSAASFNAQSLQRLLPWIELTSEKVCGKIQSFADDGRKCDLGVWLKYYAFDVREKQTVVPCFL